LYYLGVTMIRLELAGAHTRLGSTLCAECPQGPIGCCAGPPDLGLSDVGRIVALGGRDWILAEIAAGNLLPAPPRGDPPVPPGLTLRRVRRRESADTPRRKKCVYHRLGGCTVPPSRRAATCNYFLCADTFVDGGEAKGDPDAALARVLADDLRARYTRWDEDIAARLGVAFPEWRWDASLLDWLGQVFEALADEARTAGGPPEARP
jgi:hypothetical protein